MANYVSKKYKYPSGLDDMLAYIETVDDTKELRIVIGPDIYGEAFAVVYHKT